MVENENCTTCTETEKCNTCNEKQCTSCNKTKRFTEFNKRKCDTTGFSPRCKECIKDAIPTCASTEKDCKTKAVPGYSLCQKCGGGKRCQHTLENNENCLSGVTHPHDYCVPHFRLHECPELIGKQKCGTVLKPGIPACIKHGKVCTGCKEFKLYQPYFTKDKSHKKTGYKPRCKVCIDKWKTRCITILPDVKDVKKIKKIKKVQDVDNVNEVKQVEDVDEVKDVNDVKKVQEVDEVKDVKKVQDVDEVKDVKQIKEVQDVKDVSKMQCPTWAVHGYSHCKKHGGGDKCEYVSKDNIRCTTSLRPPHHFCAAHGGTVKCPITVDNVPCNKIVYDKFTVCPEHGGRKSCIVVIDDNETICGEDCPTRSNVCTEHKELITCSKCNRVTKSASCTHCYVTGSIKGRLTKLLGDVRLSDSKKEHLDDCDLTLDFLMQLYVHQDKKCYYCHIGITYESTDRHPSTVSIERLHSHLSHSKDNSVLSCMMCNYSKNSMKLDTWSWLLEILNGNVLDITPSSAELKPVFRVAPDNLKRRGAPKETNALTITDVHDMLSKQNWRCALTNLPMVLYSEAHHPLHVSIDRIDNDNKSHCASNCQLVCRFANLGRNSSTIKRYSESLKARFPTFDGSSVEVVYPIGYKHPQKKHVWSPVNCYDRSGIFVKRYDSVPKAAEAVGCTVSEIALCCKGNRNMCKNFLWSYTNKITIPNNKYMGVYQKDSGIFYAKVVNKGIKFYLGMYEEADVAAWVRDEKIKELGCLDLQLNNVKKPVGWYYKNDRGHVEASIE